MNQTRGHAGEKPFGVVLSAAALMKHKANTPLFQHICICAGYTVYHRSWQGRWQRCVASLMKAWKVNTSALAVARPMCHAWWERKGIELNSRWCLKHLLFSNDYQCLPVHWSTELGLRQICWDSLCPHNLPNMKRFSEYDEAVFQYEHDFSKTARVTFLQKDW